MERRIRASKRPIEARQGHWAHTRADGASWTPPLDQVHGKLRVRFARDEADLERVQRLRYRVFNLELREGLEASHATGRDQDPFDAQCDHLMVIDEETGEAVGTYRLQAAEAAAGGRAFYSASEFDLSSLPDDVLQDSIELGRACVAKSHRNRMALFLLWKGLAGYLLWNKKRYVFGCSSLTSQDAALGLRAYHQLEAQGKLHPSLRVEPLPHCRCEAPPAGPGEGVVEIPTLFSTYLRYGALVLGPPAIDREFGTIDFLTLIDVQSLDPKVFEGFVG
jgi:putative hemolysin